MNIPFKRSNFLFVLTVNIIGKTQYTYKEITKLFHFNLKTSRIKISTSDD